MELNSVKQEVEEYQKLKTSMLACYVHTCIRMYAYMYVRMCVYTLIMDGQLAGLSIVHNTYFFAIN